MGKVCGIRVFIPIVLAGMMSATAAMAAGEHVGPATEFAKSRLAGWMSDPTVIAAVKAQNSKQAGIDEATIKSLDKKWRAEVDASDKPLISSVLGNALSKYLKSKKDSSEGLITEIFVMDAKGLNVGQSDVTSDYWQGDEAKWKKTYLEGPDAIFVDDVEEDESTQMFQSQVSMSIKDPKTNEVIGAVTVGIDVDAL